MTGSTPPPILSHLAAITETLGPLAGKTVLDVGCGAGGLPRDLAALGADCTGIDPFMPARDWTTEGAGRWRLLTDAAQALPFADATIDVVVFLYSLHHVPAPLLDRAVLEARRVLKPDGRFYVAEPLARGDFDDLISLFHDEAEVRRRAREALESGRALFSTHRTREYVCRNRYDGFAPFATKMQANTRFNDYVAEAVVAPPVRARFEAIAARTGGVFDQPVRVDVFQAGG